MFCPFGLCQRPTNKVLQITYISKKFLRFIQWRNICPKIRMETQNSPQEFKLFFPNLYKLHNLHIYPLKVLGVVQIPQIVKKRYKVLLRSIIS
jgi:hypothetical protein